MFVLGQVTLSGGFWFKFFPLRGSRIKTKIMDKSQQLYLFIFSTTRLFTDINLTGDFSHSWFDAQSHCLNQGLTIERLKSDQPYWTGIYRRLTPWINILGCYPDSIESQPGVAEITMTISSLGICQERCHHREINRFAVKMNKCLCIDHDDPDIYLTVFDRSPASDCNFKCEGNSEDIYLDDCGGEHSYNVYETQEVYLKLVESCLSLQCSTGDIRFIPQKCSLIIEKVCENMTPPYNGYARNWSLSMKQCKKLHQSYLLGDFNLSDPRQGCMRIPHNLQLVWVGVARQKYTSIDQGWEISEKQRQTFLECQLCTNNDCCFKSCYDFAANSIFCKTDTSQRQETGNLTTSHANFLSNHLTAKQLLDQHSTIKNCDEAQQDTHQKSNANDNLALKISLPLILGIIVLLLSAVGVVFYRRRSKMTKTDRSTKAEVESVPKSVVDSKLNPVQNPSYFELEQCSQKIHTVNDSPNENPYNNSEDGDYDHLRDKKSRKPEVEDTYQHATDMFEYDTMANTDNKKQEEGASYDYSHLDSYGNYACDLGANNQLTDNPYDVAV